MSITCYVCRDEGSREGCPKCGKTITAKEIKFDFSGDEYIEKLIPLHYRSTGFNYEELVSSYNTLASDVYFTKYASTLDKILDLFKVGKIPSKSALVVSPKRFGKTIWAYSCMKYAHVSGYTTFPMLDTQQIKRFLTLAVEKPRSEYIRGLSYTYEDFINADVVFISVVKDSYRYSSYEVIDQVLDMRGRNGKVTFILSEFNLKTISYYDRDNRFAQLFRNVPGADHLRYPVLINYSSKLTEDVDRGDN